MKKIISLIVVITVLFCQSCDKEETAFEQPFDSSIIWKSKSESSLNQLGETSTTALKSLDCESDFKVQNYLNYLALSLLDLTMDKQFNKEIIQMSLENNLQIADIADLSLRHSSYYNEINNKLKEIVLANKDQKLNIVENTIEAISNNLTYTGNGLEEKYVPIIFVYNAEEADVNLQPIVSAGIAVNGDLFPEFDDYYYVWILQGDGSFKEYILSEEQAKALKNPIFVVDNGQMKSKRLGQETLVRKNANQSPTLKGMDLEDYCETYYFRINYRYESSGNSDYNMLAWGLGPNGEDTEILRNSSNNLKERIELCSVDPDDIGTTLYSDTYFSYYYPSTWYLFFQCFERDWLRSSKFLGVGSGNGKSHYFYGNVQYESEWYAWDTTTSLDEIGLPSLGYYTFTFDSSKGFQEIIRAL